MEFIWHILLTVCLNSNCRTQYVQWFDREQECRQMLPVYRSIPQDGDWTSVTYICKPINSRGT